MSSTINASSAGIVETADSSGILEIQTGGITGIYMDASQNITIPKNLTIDGTLTYSGGSGGVTTFSGGSTGLTPSTPTAGAVSLAGTLSYLNGGTGLNSSGTSGNVLVSNGSGWSSSTLASAGIAGLSSPTFSGTVTTSGLSCTGTVVAQTGLQIGSSAGYGLDINSGYTEMLCNAAGSLKLYGSGNIIINGSIAQKASGTTWNNPSDIRLKNNVADYTDGLAKLLQVNPKTWTYNGLANTTNGQAGLGVIADEIQSVLPNTVSTYSVKLNPSDTTNTDVKQFDATEITWLLVNAVKELNTTITTQAATIATQATQIATMTTQIAALNAKVGI